MNTWINLYTKIKEYIDLEELEEASKLCLYAHTLYPEHSEGFYRLTYAYRNKNDYENAIKFYHLGYSIPKPEDVLEEDIDIYEHLFIYEKLLLASYMKIDKEIVLQTFIEYINDGNSIEYNMLEHLTYAYSSIDIIPLNFPEISDYLPTSTSILRISPDKYLLNIRYVNYRIQPNSCYLMMNNGKLSGDNDLSTINMKLIVNNDFKPIDIPEEMFVNEKPYHSKNIRGIEDIRLYNENNEIHFIAATCEYSHNGNIQQVTGKYDIDTLTLTNINPLVSLENSYIEKNWIPTGKSSFIYKWYPYTLTEIYGNSLRIIKIEHTPLFFSHMRGSSTLVTYNGSMYCMIHCVIDSRPRKYYHSLVKLNADTLSLESYTLPLYFKNNYIEYTIGIDIRDDILYSIVSQNDCNPILVKIPMNTLKWLPIQIQ